MRSLFRLFGVMIFLNRSQNGILFDVDDGLTNSSAEFPVVRVMIGTVVAVDAARDPFDVDN